MDTKYRYPRYVGDIPTKGKDGWWWHVAIYFAEDQNAATPVTARTLTFPAEEPLVIDWEEMRPEDVFQGAAATLRVESMTDREFINFYTYKPGEIWMRVYRTKQPWLAVQTELWWQGSLDPEQYEEPYESASGYTVSLTFTDFGYLERLKYNLHGPKTIETVFRQALERIGFPPSADLIETHISTDIPAESDDDDPRRLTLADIACASENWYDEEGEASTLRDVLENLFLPLALHVTQRAGKIIVYDFNQLYHGAGLPVSVRWTSDSQTLSTAETYNNVRLTFSPYCDSADTMVSLEYKGTSTTDIVSYSPYFPAWDTKADYDKYGLVLSFRRDWEKYGKYDDGSYRRDWEYVSFNICFDSPDKVKGVTVHQNYTDRYNKVAGYQKDGVYDIAETPPTGSYSAADTDLWPKGFKICPMLDGEEAEGVAVMVTAGCGSLREAWDPRPGTEGNAPLHRHGAPCDAPWGLYNSLDMIRRWIDAANAGTYRWDLFDYLCAEMVHPSVGGNFTVDAASTKVLTTDPVYLPPVPMEKQKVIGENGAISEINSQKRSPFLVRLEVPMLLDARYNFQTDNGLSADDDKAKDRNDERNQIVMKRNARWVFVPFTAVIRDADGHITHVYSNRKVMQRCSPGLLSYALGEWIPAGNLTRYELDCYDPATGTSSGLGVASATITLKAEMGKIDRVAKKAVTAKAYTAQNDIDNVDSYFGQAWLAYYDSDPYQEESTGIGGWQSNRHNIGPADLMSLSAWRDFFNNPTFKDSFDIVSATIADMEGAKIFPSFSKLKDGEYLPYPPAGGFLEVTIYRGILARSEKDIYRLESPANAWATADVDDVKSGKKDLAKMTQHGDRQGIYNMVRWHLFKAPEIEVVRNDMTFDSASVDDYELSAYLNRDAHEELTLDTSFGTIPELCPLARGLMVYSDTGLPVSKLTRAGRTDSPEKLLLGTLYSQYSRRCTTLEGEAGLVHGSTARIYPPVYSDEAQSEWWELHDGGALETVEPRFYEVSRTDNLTEMTTELKLGQFRDDHYSAEDIQEVED